MNNSNNAGPWWRRQNRDRLQDRIREIGRINDPGTSADEILRYGTIGLYLLLAFTGFLGAFSYYRFFSTSFPAEAAAAMAVLLTAAIESGKNYAGRWAIRKPMFSGFASIWETPAHTFSWLGLAMVAVGTFAMSIYNSTKGGEQLSLLLHHERNEAVFSPKTADIDAQIQACQDRMDRNNKNTWKGIVIYESQKANRKETAIMADLQRQKDAQIQMQRADYERQRSIKDQQGNFGASSVMAAGGWVEMLQAIILIILVSCEKILDRRAATHASAPSIGYNRPVTGVPQPAVSNGEERRSIGFQYTNRDVPAEARLQQDSGASVSHVTQPVTQQSGGNASIGAGDALMAIRTALMRDVRNLETGNGFTETILKRVEAQLWRAIELYDTPGFAPEAQKRTVFEAYVTGVFEPKMIALEADAETKDKQHYSFIRVQRTDSLLSKIVPQA